MRAIFAGLCLVVFATAPAAAQTGATPALFVVRDADSTLYLYGTTHLLPPGAPWASQAVLEAIEHADEVWTEGDTSEAASRHAMAELESALLIPAPTPLLQRLPPAQRGRIMYIAKAMGIPRANLDQLEPWQAALMLTQLGMLDTDRTLEAGADTQVVRTAQRAGKRLRWLEELSAAEFAAMSDAAQIGFLIATLEGFDDNALPSIVDGEALWARGELERLFEAEIAPLRANHPAFYHWIMVARNTAWVDVLVGELEGAGVDFVAVGAAHLAGPESLIVMLTARGYGVERVGGAP